MQRPPSALLAVKQQYQQQQPYVSRAVPVKQEQSRPSVPERRAPLNERELFVERKRAESSMRDMACKAICRIKHGLRQKGVQEDGRPFTPSDWDRVFKPVLGSYIKFLLTRPDQFRVIEGVGPGLYTIDDLTGSKVVVAPSWDELSEAKGKGKGKGKGKDEGKGKGKDKGKGKGKDDGQFSGGKVGGKGQVFVGSKGSGLWVVPPRRLTPRPPSLPPPAAAFAAAGFAHGTSQAPSMDEEEADADEEEALADEFAGDEEDYEEVAEEEAGGEESAEQAEAEAEPAEDDWEMSSWPAAEEAIDDGMTPSSRIPAHGSLISSLLSGGLLGGLQQKRPLDGDSSQGDSKRSR